MLFDNNTNKSGVKILGGSLQCITHYGSSRNYFIANGSEFGSKISRPQGYNTLTTLTAPLQTSGNIASNTLFDHSLVGDLWGIGQISSLPSIGTSLSIDGNVLANMYVLPSMSVDGVGSIRATGNISSTVDIIAKPSAFDIAQEIWNAQTTGYTSTGTMGKALNDAGAAGNPWSADLSTNNSSGTFGWLIQKLLTVTKFLALK